MESAPFRGKFLESQFDSIMGHIGWLKKFSVQTYAVMFACVVFGAMNIASTVFIAANTPHTCQVEPEIIKNVTLSCNMNWTEVQSDMTRPFDNKTKRSSQCSRYTLDSLLANTSCDYWLHMNTSSQALKEERCSHWVYDRSTYQTTVVSQFNLVCDQKWKIRISQFFLMSGIFFGALLCGVGSDRWGRRTLFLIALIVLLVSAAASSLVKSFWIFTVLRFFVGFGGLGACVTGYVYAMETTSNRHRVIIGQTLQATFSVGFMLLAFAGFAERRWVALNLGISLPLAILLPLYIRFSAESPRWLLSRNQVKKSEDVLARMARVNGKNFDDIIAKLEAEQSNTSLTANMKYDSFSPRESCSTMDLFRNPKLRIISLVLFYNWFAVTCIYYGLTLNSAALNWDPFLSFFFSGLIEIPANFGSIFIIQLWGRRPTIVICNVVCGISLLCLTFVSNEMIAAQMTLFLMGKFGSTGTFSCIYLYSSELYPTSLRGNGVGICSACARLGGMASQLIFMLAHINNNLPYIVLGAIAIVAGILIAILPETKGMSLPETMKDTEQMYVHRNVSLLKQFVPSTARSCCT